MEPGGNGKEGKMAHLTIQAVDSPDRCAQYTGLRRVVLIRCDDASARICRDCWIVLDGAAIRLLEEQ